MPISAITIDFWNTLFDSTGGAPRNTARQHTLRDAVRRSGHSCTDEALADAYKGIWDYFDHQWLEKQRTPTSDEMVREICRRAGVVLDEQAVLAVAEQFSRGILDHPPALLPGVHEALAYLSTRAHLAVISDTAFSAGSVLREVMELNSIAHYFSAFVFSDETGVAKPHPEAFHQALRVLDREPSQAIHIGDIERTDIAGAKAVGMRAILYRGDSDPHKYAEEATSADAVMRHWDEISVILGEMGGEH